MNFLFLLEIRESILALRDSELSRFERFEGDETIRSRIGGRFLYGSIVVVTFLRGAANPNRADVQPATKTQFPSPTNY